MGWTSWGFKKKKNLNFLCLCFLFVDTSVEILSHPGHRAELRSTGLEEVSLVIQKDRPVGSPGLSKTSGGVLQLVGLLALKVKSVAGSHDFKVNDGC